MSATYFFIAIMGCADGGSACTPVATLPTRYTSERQCVSETAPALASNSDFDFPTIVARCRPGVERTNFRVTDTRAAGTAIGR